MVQFLSVDDLQAFEPDINEGKAIEMIADAEALALLAAPCLAGDEDSLTAGQVAGVKAILRGAVLRWNEAGTGAFSAQSVTRGPFGASETYDTRQQRRGMFWPSEIEQLQRICNGSPNSGAFTVDTAGGVGSWGHADICALNFGALYCSCGAVLTQNGPLYETGGY